MDKTLNIITVAFNNYDIIEIQFNFLKKNIMHDFIYHVIDNSNDIKISNLLYNFCQIHHIDYLKTDINVGSNFSSSHGMALNYGLMHIQFKQSHILLLDHDIIPFNNISFNSINTTFYGHKQIRNDMWYMWPGFCLIENKNEILKQLDFLPCDSLDTGGKNWHNIFKNKSTYTYSFITEFYYCSLLLSINNYLSNNKHFEKSINNSEYDYWHKNNDMFEYLDGWIHFINTSNWNKMGSKIDKIKQFVNLIN